MSSRERRIIRAIGLIIFAVVAVMVTITDNCIFDSTVEGNKVLMFVFQKEVNWISKSVSVLGGGCLAKVLACKLKGNTGRWVLSSSIMMILGEILNYAFKFPDLLLFAWIFCVYSYHKAFED